MASSSDNAAASIILAVSSLISALAWPTLVGTLLLIVYRHADKIVRNFNRFMHDKSSAKLALSPTGGISFEIVEKTANESAEAVIQSAEKSQTGPLNDTQIAEVTLSAKAAAFKLATNVLDPKKRLKVLWVDDHPENNIDLQFAFQTLGIIIVCIDSNEYLQQAFSDASKFDVVITDMGRDGFSSRHADPEAGLMTAKMVKDNYPNAKIIIYAGRWAASHRSDRLDHVILITDYTQEVYSTVIDLAKKKAS